VVFGLKYGGTVLYRYFMTAFSKLSQETRSCLLRKADDILSGQNTHERMYLWLRDFLPICKAAGISLEATKTKCGYPAADFSGHRLDGGTVRVLDDNLAPISGLVDPDGVPALHRVLGLINMNYDFVERCAFKLAPLTRLTGKVPWTWGDVEHKAFTTVRDDICSAPVLFAPDYSLVN
jgi:hypothetical protein